ncbi:MAG: aminoacyl-histidine dipeptidase [Anaerotignaceae bacterium]
MRILNNVKPMDVFSIFEDICQIPHGSTNEKAVSEYISGYGKKLGLETIADEAYNVIIKKDGTKGYENSPTVILQGHMDMVCEKNANVDFDFMKDPLKLLMDGDYITADGTTLGADNGIAVAYMLAILKDNTIDHPPIECIFTSDEEAGMNGARSLDCSGLKGKYLINLDTEEEGHILTSCAGGLRAKIAVPITWAKTTANHKCCNVVIKGLKGGHSGADIHLQRANANKLMGRLLKEIMKDENIYVGEINGGNMDNAITRECESILVYEGEKFAQIYEICKTFETLLKKEYLEVDDGIIITVEELDTTPELVFSWSTAKQAVSVLMLIPYGVQFMSKDIEGLVESSNNIGIVRTYEEEIIFTCATRSSVGSRKGLLCEEMETLATLVGGTFEMHGEYPEWEFKKESKLREIMAETYKNMFGKEAKIDAIHAGLECGLLGKKISNCDMVSIGPNMADVHTPDERISISSTERTYLYLKEILKNLK